MALLTLVYVGATIGIVLLGRRANALAQANLKTLAELEQEKSRPLVDVEIFGEVPFVSLRVTNRGLTPAYDVKITTMPQLRLLLGGENAISPERKEKQIGILEHGIGSLAPSSNATALIGTFARVKEVNPSLQFTGTVTYRSALGRSYEFPVNLDLRYMENTLHINRKTIHDVANELEEIRKEINHIGTGFHKPHVIVQDVKEKRTEDEEFVRSIQEKQQGKMA